MIDPSLSIHDVQYNGFFTLSTQNYCAPIRLGSGPQEGLNHLVIEILVDKVVLSVFY